MAAEWIAVDWGTSNHRLWGIGPDRATEYSRTSDQGMGKLTRDVYPGVLTGLLADAIPAGASMDGLI